MKFIASPFCIPSIPVTTEKVGCIDKDGKKNHILILTIPASPDLHTNHQDDAYYRMGDKSHKLIFLRTNADALCKRKQVLRR